MKKLTSLTFLVIVTFVMRSQSSLEVKHMAAGTGALVSDKQTIAYTISSNGSVNTEIDIKNTSSATRDYKVRRMDDVLNNQAQAYFSVGSGHFAPQTMVSPLTITLMPGQTASSQHMNIVMYMEEGTAPGFSSVRYQVFNINDASDVFELTLKYNDNSVSVKEMSGELTASSGVYPNPSAATAYVDVDSAHDVKQAKLSVTNLVGELIYEKGIPLSKGKNVLSFEREQLAPGIYLVTVSSGTEHISRRFTVSR